MLKFVNTPTVYGKLVESVQIYQNYLWLFDFEKIPIFWQNFLKQSVMFTLIKSWKLRPYFQENIQRGHGIQKRCFKKSTYTLDMTIHLSCCHGDVTMNACGWWRLRRALQKVHKMYITFFFKSLTLIHFFFTKRCVYPYSKCWLKSTTYFNYLQ